MQTQTNNNQQKLQNKPRRLEIKPEDLAKVQRVREQAEKARVDDEWKFVAEFGTYFGWDGAQAILNDEIDLDVAQKMLAGARKVHYAHLIDYAVAMQVAYGSTKTKNPASKFKQGLQHFIKEAR